MEELIGRITAAVGIDESTAQTAIGVILGFLNKEGPSDAVSQLLAAIPGAEDILAGLGDAGADDDAGGGLGGALGGLLGGSGGGSGGGLGGGLGGLAGAVGGLMNGQGGLMAAAGELMGAGLDMDQIQGTTQEIVGFAREKAGDELVGQIMSQIPGMDQFT